MPNETAAIEVENLVRRFGDVEALSCVSVTIQKGEFFSLLGPSGCGKTTLLRIIASLDDFVVSFFTTGPRATTLPILIYSSIKRGITPDINALSTLIVLASIVGTLGVALLQRARQSA